ncbi:mCG1028297, isoform CRA_b [Mus musculus]|nr:mCG1028297, isoform CRA_b [Mus musculus]
MKKSCPSSEKHPEQDLKQWLWQTDKRRELGAVPINATASFPQ